MNGKAIAYRVFLRGRHIDTVWFTGYTAEEARRSLIDHDGYDPAIVVRP
jgi:hypothetical protein